MSIADVFSSFGEVANDAAKGRRIAHDQAQQDALFKLQQLQAQLGLKQGEQNLEMGKTRVPVGNPRIVNGKIYQIYRDPLTGQTTVESIASGGIPSDAEEKANEARSYLHTLLGRDPTQEELARYGGVAPPRPSTEDKEGQLEHLIAGYKQRHPKPDKMPQSVYDEKAEKWAEAQLSTWAGKSFFGFSAGGKKIDLSGMTANEQREFKARTDYLTLTMKSNLADINRRISILTAAAMNPNADASQVAAAQTQLPMLEQQAAELDSEIASQESAIYNDIISRRKGRQGEYGSQFIKGKVFTEGKDF